MSTKQTEALKLALEALEDISSHYMSLPKKGCMALAAIEEALAEQETVLPGGGHVPAVPVAVYGYCPECGGAGVMRERRPNGDDKCTNGHKYPSSKALAEQPAQQEQGDSNCQDADGCPTELAVLQRFWRGEPIPAEHYPVWFKPAQQQEPVAITITGKLGNIYSFTGDYSLKKGDKVYTTPPQRKPLTDQEIRDWWRIENGLEDCNMAKLVDFTLAVRAIEAKLKEKNT